MSSVFRSYPQRGAVSAIPLRSPAQSIHAFNKYFPVGTKVRYWRDEKNGPPTGIGRTLGPAYIFAGQIAVVCIEGLTGCAELDKVEVIG